ncbi:MAG: hypothetical protein OEZ05_11650 [Nitrospirota bacterium]|nr:hypothetical protein [Nitrospirota bacterium]MDH5587273.1 hypothetical protein [Nitrospirota bacterium]
MTAFEKDYAARRFSIRNNGVGVFVNFAAVPELPPEPLIRAIEGNFSKKGISRNLQSNKSRGDLTTVTFFAGTPFAGKTGNGYDLDESAGGFDTIVRAFEQQQAKRAAKSFVPKLFVVFHSSPSL